MKSYHSAPDIMRSMAMKASNYMHGSANQMGMSKRDREYHEAQHSRATHLVETLIASDLEVNRYHQILGGLLTPDERKCTEKCLIASQRKQTQALIACQDIRKDNSNDMHSHHIDKVLYRTESTILRRSMDRVCALLNMGMWRCVYRDADPSEWTNYTDAKRHRNYGGGWLQRK